MTKYALLAALAVALVASGLLIREMRVSGRLAAENGSLRASNAALQRRANDAMIAEAIARQTIKDEQSRILYLSEALELLNGGPDVPLPDHILDVLRGAPDGL
jgi:hypothetical protein